MPYAIPPGICHGEQGTSYECYRIEGMVNSGGEIAIPREIAAQIPAGEHVRVVVMWQPSSGDPDWQRAGRRSFESAYCTEDAVYEQLVDDSTGR